jgi:protein SCO1
MSSYATAFITERHVLFLLLAGSLLVELMACKSQPAPSQTGRYQLNGVVLSVEKPERSVVVKHEEIPGFMSAMTMPYEVSDEKDLAKLSPGTEIRADLVVSGESTRLENIRVIKKNFEEEGTL